MLPELAALEKILDLGAPHLEVQVVQQVSVASGPQFPIYAIGLGNPALDVPAVGFFGGVHGLERIGAEVVIAYLQNVVMRLQWDTTLHQQLDGCAWSSCPSSTPAACGLPRVPTRAGWT